MPVRLRREEIVTIEVLAEKGQNHCEIARTLGVSEGTVRYHLRRGAAAAEDGRANKPFLAEEFAELIAAWFAERAADTRPVNVLELYEHLVEEHSYAGSYQSVRRYARVLYPRPQLRTLPAGGNAARRPCCRPARGPPGACATAVSFGSNSEHRPMNRGRKTSRSLRS